MNRPLRSDNQKIGVHRFSFKLLISGALATSLLTFIPHEASAACTTSGTTQTCTGSQPGIYVFSGTPRTSTIIMNGVTITSNSIGGSGVNINVPGAITYTEQTAPSNNIYGMSIIQAANAPVSLTTMKGSYLARENYDFNYPNILSVRDSLLNPSTELMDLNLNGTISPKIVTGDPDFDRYIDTVSVYRYGAGVTNITNTGLIEAGKVSRASLAVEAVGGAVTIRNSGTIKSRGSVDPLAPYNPPTGSAIYVKNSGVGSINIINTGTIERDKLHPSSSALISINNNNGGVVGAPATITNEVGASILAASATEVAIGATAGSKVHVINKGTILGKFDPPTLTDVFEIDNYGTWSFDGANDGINIINNYGVMIDEGRSTQWFSGEDTALNNSGRILLSNGNMSGSDENGHLSFYGLNNLNNSGIIDMRSSSSAEYNGEDRTQVGNYVYTDGNFNASGSSLLGVQTQLGGNGSKSDFLGVGGNVTGRTGIVVQDTGGASRFNSKGTAIVGINGSGNASNFYLAPGSTYYSPYWGGVLNKGFFTYFLGNTSSSEGCSTIMDGSSAAANCVSLFSRPNYGLANQIAVGVSGANRAWDETALLWEDRQSEIRNLLMTGNYSQAVTARNGSQPQKPGVTNVPSNVWAKGIGSWTNRNATSNDGLYAMEYNLGYKQNTFGILGGIDFVHQGLLSQDDSLILGGLGGYMNSSLYLNQGGSSYKYEGGSVGASATYYQKGFFMDGLFKADIMNMTLGLPSLTTFGFSSGSVAAATWGLMGNTGYHFDLGMLFVEPILTMSYARSGFGNIALPNMESNLVFGSGEALRGAAGGRIGKSFVELWDKHRIDLVFTGRAWNQWSGNNNTVMIDSPGFSFYGADNFYRTFGEAKGGVDVISLGSGVGGFVNGGTRWNQQFSTYFVKGGLTYTW